MKTEEIWKTIIHPIAIILGAWGAFPEPPMFLLRLSRFELFQYFMVFVLLYQGGSQQQLATALMVTVGFYLLNKIFDLRGIIGQLESRAAVGPIPEDPIRVTRADEEVAEQFAW